MEISAFRGNIHVPWILSTFHGNIHVPSILSAFCVYILILWILSASRGNIHVTWILSVFCAYIRILRILSASRGNIYIPWILSVFHPFYLSNFTHLVKVTGAQIAKTIQELKILKGVVKTKPSRSPEISEWKNSNDENKGQASNPKRCGGKKT